MIESEIRLHLDNQWWRLNNLYWITDKRGRRVKFKLNWAQKYLFNNMWYLNIILKARQLGLTTFIQIYMLDVCLFNNNQSAGVIAHNREDAEEFFGQKIKFAYDNLPDWLRKDIPNTSDSAKKLAFDNGSSIRVGTSLRSGTLQYLHISEFGKICSKFPDKAEEIISGSLNTVEAGQFVFIESTAEGAWGRFYSMCQDGIKAAGTNLGKMDYRFFFYPWYKEPSYTLDEDRDIDAETTAYLDQLEVEQEITFTQGQRAWYHAKKATQKTKMKPEYPSTPSEAFERLSEYAVFGKEMREAYSEKRIRPLRYDPAYPVHTFWDLGRSKTDATSIWFAQHIQGEFYFIDFYQNFKMKVSHYVQVLQQRPYVYGTDHLPHDGGHNDFELEDYEDKLRKLGRTNITIVPRTPHLNLAIQSTRDMFPKAHLCSEKCVDGISALGAYSYEWDEKLGTAKEPKHDWASHPASAFMQCAQGFRPLAARKTENLSPRRAEAIRNNRTRSGVSHIV